MFGKNKSRKGKEFTPAIISCKGISFPQPDENEHLKLRRQLSQMQDVVAELSKTMREYAKDSAVLSGVCRVLNDAVLRISQDGVVTDLNRSAEKLFKVTADVKGKAFHYLTGIDFQEFLKKIPDSGKAQFKMINNEYGTFDASISLTRISHDMNEADEYICVVRDISDILRMKTALIDSDVRFEVLSKALDEAKDVILITDHNNHIIFVNRAFSEYTGYSLEEARGRDPNFYASGMVDEATYEDMWQTLNEGRMWSGNLINTSKGGKLLRDETFIFPVVISAAQQTKPSFYIAVKYVMS